MQAEPRSNIPFVKSNPDYARIINREGLERLTRLGNGKALSNVNILRMAPLVITDATAQDAVMQEELFGPLMPVLPIAGLKCCKQPDIRRGVRARGVGEIHFRRPRRVLRLKTNLLQNRSALSLFQPQNGTGRATRGLFRFEKIRGVTARQVLGQRSPKNS